MTEKVLAALLLHRHIERELGRIPRNDAQKLVDAMRQLRDGPRPTNAKHLIEELYRIRVGDYRIVYAVFDAENVVFIGKVARRSEKTYRNLSAILSAAHRALVNKNRPTTDE